MKAKKRGEWLIAKMGDTFVMMNREKVQHVGVSEIGARIWELIGSAADIDEVCGQLCREYAVSPEACRAEVDLFLHELVDNDAIRLEP